MVNEQKELQQLFSIMEKNEQLLANLENLKASGSVSEDHYTALKGGYVRSINEAGNIIETRKANILQAIASEEQKIAMLDNEIKTLSVRQQIGELTSVQAQKNQEKLQKQVQQNQNFIADMRRLHASTRSTDVGGFVETKTTIETLAKNAARGSSSAGGTGIAAAIQGTSPNDFTEIRTDVGEITGTPIQLLGPIGGVLLLISLYQPAYTVSGLGYSVSSVTLMSLSDNPSLGTILMLMAIASMGSALLARENARGIVQLGAGIIGILMLLLEVSTRMSQMSSGLTGTFAKALGVGASPGLGIILAAVGLIVIIASGYKELNR